jgi:transcriptional regulator with XRE-family HTH domain
MGATISIAEIIRIQREDEQHWSQPEAARRAGISASYWRRIEGGGAAPDDTVARMLYVLDLTPEQLQRLGYPGYAAGVEKCAAVMGSGNGNGKWDGHHDGKRDGHGLPSFIATEAEAYLYGMPGVSEPVRRSLILHLRTLLRAERDPLAQALLGERPAAGQRPARA